MIKHQLKDFILIFLSIYNNIQKRIVLKFLYHSTEPEIKLLPMVTE
jgi:hypothetical protein